MRIWLILAIVGATGVAAAFGWLVTTFLFAFSSGQGRMVPVVGYGALAMVAVPLVVGTVAWRLRTPLIGFIGAMVAIGAGWVVLIIVEWLISFQLGASSPPPA